MYRLQFFYDQYQSCLNFTTNNFISVSYRKSIILYNTDRIVRKLTLVQTHLAFGIILICRLLQHCPFQLFEGQFRITYFIELLQVFVHLQSGTLVQSFSDFPDINILKVTDQVFFKMLTSLVCCLFDGACECQYLHWRSLSGTHRRDFILLIKSEQMLHN